jgi:hypothetical protein
MNIPQIDDQIDSFNPNGDFDLLTSEIPDEIFEFRKFDNEKLNLNTNDKPCHICNLNNDDMIFYCENLVCGKKYHFNCLVENYKERMQKNYKNFSISSLI